MKAKRSRMCCKESVFVCPAETQRSFHSSAGKRLNSSFNLWAVGRSCGQQCKRSLQVCIRDFYVPCCYFGLGDKPKRFDAVRGKRQYLAHDGNRFARWFAVTDSANRAGIKYQDIDCPD